MAFLTHENIAEILAKGICEQCEIDNMGDGESVVFLGPLPALNLVRLAKHLTDAIGRENFLPFRSS